LQLSLAAAWRRSRTPDPGQSWLSPNAPLRLHPSRGIDLRAQCRRHAVILRGIACRHPRHPSYTTRIDL
jgi:hypothetical protein